MDVLTERFFFERFLALYFATLNFVLLGSETVQLLSPFYYHVSERKIDDYI